MEMLLVLNSIVPIMFPRWFSILKHDDCPMGLTANRVFNCKEHVSLSPLSTHSVDDAAMDANSEHPLTAVTRETSVSRSNDPLYPGKIALFFVEFGIVVG